MTEKKVSSPLKNIINFYKNVLKESKTVVTCSTVNVVLRCARDGSRVKEIN